MRSRILYEQMLGRATRLCDDIGKERFLVFDAVNLCSALEPYSDKKPVVVQPRITSAQLAQELVVAPDDAGRQVGQQRVLRGEEAEVLGLRGRRWRGQGWSPWGG